MGLLDFDDTYKPPFSPPKLDADKRSQEERDSELNNLGRKRVSDDYSDSPRHENRNN